MRISTNGPCQLATSFGGFHDGGKVIDTIQVMVMTMTQFKTRTAGQMASRVKGPFEWLNWYGTIPRWGPKGGKRKLCWRPGSFMRLHEPKLLR